METPEIFHTDCCYTASDAKNGDHFVVEDLLDFPNEECTAVVDGGLEAAMTGTSADSSTVTVVDTSCNSPFCGGGTVETHFSSAGGQFSSEICVPYDDVAELEWLSNFVEESFSSEDLQQLQLIQGMKPRNTDASGTQHYQFQPETTKLPPEISVPGKARSKRSRAAHWASPLLAVAPTPNTNTVATPSSPEPVVKKASKLRKEAPENSSGGGEGRRCFHCATDKTPQWRTGPMGPKTLCNACGVRYKSGRLVPEYRPAASPTFVMTKHSNSHRKVLELRRQKEAQRSNHVQQHGFLNHYHNLMYDESDGGDYLIHQHVGPDFTQLI